MTKYKEILAPARGRDVGSKGEHSLAGVGIKPTWYMTSQLYHVLVVTLGKFLTFSSLVFFIRWKFCQQLF